MSTAPDNPISANNIETVMNGGLSTNYPGATSTLTFNDELVRTLAGKHSGIISMNDMRNKAGPLAYGTFLRTTTCTGSSMGTMVADGRYNEIVGPSIPNSPLCIPPGTLLRTISNPNQSPVNTNFGNAVAVYGDYLVVAAWHQYDNGIYYSGKVYVYNITDGSLIYTINNPNAYGSRAGDSFGYSVAVSDTYIAVGTINESDAAGTNSGKVYVFNINNGSLRYTLDNPNKFGNTSTNDNFGYSVAISGNFIIVGAIGEDDVGGLFNGFPNNAGKAYIFNSSTGALIYTLNNPNSSSTDSGDLNENFGYSVSLSGSYACVSAPGANSKVGIDSGTVHVFNVSTGALLYSILDPNGYGFGYGDGFGRSLSASGNFLVVGAQYEGDSGGSSSGKVYVFNITDGSLIYTLDNPNKFGTSANDYFGYKVSASSGYLVVSAINEGDTRVPYYSGKVYVYRLSDGVLLYTFDNPNPDGTTSYDQFGFSVAVSNQYVIASSPYENNSIGVVYIYST